MERCDLKTGECESKPCPSTAPEEKCACGGGCGGDPVTCAMLMWKCTFHTAMKEVMVDIMKAKIQKSFGAKLEKGADAVMSAMEVKWQAKMAMAKAKMDLKEKMQEAMMKK